MKHLKVILALLLVGLFAGCSKETLLSEDENVDGKVRVAFTVSGFEHELVPFPNPIIASAEKGFFSATGGSGSTDIRDHINVLDIYVYYGNRVGHIDYVRQYADDAGFGTYEKYLDTNEYHISTIRVAFHGVKLSEGMSTEWVHTDRSTAVGVRVQPEIEEAFSNNLIFRLGDAIDENITLGRYVGRVDLNLEENIPSNAGYIDISIENTAKYFSPIQEVGFTEAIGDDDPDYETIKRIQILPEHIDNSALQEQIYFVPREKKGSGPSQARIKVTAYSNTDELIREVSLSNVSIQANKVTKLSGTIFTIPNLKQDIGLDTEWDGEFPERNF